MLSNASKAQPGDLVSLCIGSMNSPNIVQEYWVFGIVIAMHENSTGDIFWADDLGIVRGSLVYCDLVTERSHEA